MAEQVLRGRKTEELDATPYWEDSAPMPRFGPLDRNLTVDVAVIGAGITGMTAAYLLKAAGCTVALLDRRRAGGVDTGQTTAHVTCVTDLDLIDLVDKFGRDHAQAVWDAGMAAIDQIEDIVNEADIDCEWVRVSGFKHAALDGPQAQEDERPRLKEEAALARSLGFEAEYVDRAQLVGKPGVEFRHQAKFHPRKYLSGLARLVDGGGSHIFEHTESEEITDDPLTVKAGGYSVRCGRVVIATHTPLMGKTNTASALALQTKLYLYTTYVLGGRMPKGTAPEASFWDTADPYHYLRIDAHRDYDYAIFGGEDHKTGQVSDTNACFRALEQSLRQLLPDIEITHRWSGQVIETNDGLPFIGETSSRQFAATGYAGNGMTFGTVAAMMARDDVTGRSNPWSGLFDVGRTKIKGGAWDYIKENADYPYYMLRDRLRHADVDSVREIPSGEGRIVDLNGERVAAYRSDRGKMTLLSPVCTHLACIVGWNHAERTWDCPCHGSRFTPRGEVLSGPAESPLKPWSAKRS